MQRLSAENKRRIFGFCNPDDIIHLSQVNRELHSLVTRHRHCLPLFDGDLRLCENVRGRMEFKLLFYNRKYREQCVPKKLGWLQSSSSKSRTNTLELPIKETYSDEHRHIIQRSVLVPEHRLPEMLKELRAFRQKRLSLRGPSVIKIFRLLIAHYQEWNTAPEIMELNDMKITGSKLQDWFEFLRVIHLAHRPLKELRITECCFDRFTNPVAILCQLGSLYYTDYYSDGDCYQHYAPDWLISYGEWRKRAKNYPIESERHRKLLANLYRMEIEELTEVLEVYRSCKSDDRRKLYLALWPALFVLQTQILQDRHINHDKLSVEILLEKFNELSIAPSLFDKAKATESVLDGEKQANLKPRCFGGTRFVDSSNVSDCVFSNISGMRERPWWVGGRFSLFALKEIGHAYVGNR